MTTDNASGVAAPLEIAREVSARREQLGRDVLFAAFSAEESGVLGSTHFNRARGDAGMNQIAAMINLDMVGRLRGNRLSVLGSDSAQEWASLIQPACEKARVECVAPGATAMAPATRRRSTPRRAGAAVLHWSALRSPQAEPSFRRRPRLS